MILIPVHIYVYDTRLHACVHSTAGLQCTLLGQNLSFECQPSEFVQILHTGAAHWICISTIGCENGQVNILDSLYTSLPTKASDQVAALLHTKLSSLKLYHLDVVEQNGGNDCGCYAIAFAEALCRGEDPVMLDFKQSEMRRHLLSCLSNGSFTPFPAKPRQVSVRVKKVVNLPICCHCRLPETQKMIKCGSCLEWYHSRCESIQSGHWKKPSTWRCKNCA